jgi:hypothetical protein
MHNLVLSHLSDFPGFWDYAHPVNAITVLIVISLFILALRILAKAAPLLLILALGVFLWHHVPSVREFQERISASIEGGR